MPGSSRPRATLLSTALLLLSLPACSSQSLVPVAANAPSPPPTEKASVPPVVPGTPLLADNPEPGQAGEPGKGENFLDPGKEAEGGLFGATWDRRLQNDIDLGKEDIAHYYTATNLGELAVAVGLAAPLANTPADLSIRRWYQRRIRTATTDEFANLFEYGGQFWVILPIGLEAAALLGKGDDDYPRDGGLYEWSNRSLRSLAVGFPPVLLMYGLLGSSRPDRDNSHWHPFQDFHGVSGHTFVGAVPFLTAAEMIDNPYYKYPLLLGSFLTGWARINNDKHFFSQMALGWWMAYSSVRSVSDTQADQRSLRLGPAWVGDGPGVALQVEY